MLVLNPPWTSFFAIRVWKGKSALWYNIKYAYNFMLITVSNKNWIAVSVIVSRSVEWNIEWLTVVALQSISSMAQLCTSMHSPIQIFTDHSQAQGWVWLWNCAMSFILTTALKLLVFSAHLWVLFKIFCSFTPNWLCSIRVGDPFSAFDHVGNLVRLLNLW